MLYRCNPSAIPGCTDRTNMQQGWLLAQAMVMGTYMTQTHTSHIRHTIKEDVRWWWASTQCCRDVSHYQCLHFHIDGLVQDTKNNAWFTGNHDFMVTSEVICQWLANHLTSDQKIVIHGNRLFYFLHAIICLKQTISLQTIIDRSFHHCH